MALAELVQKLRTKKQTAERSAFGRYLEAVRDLASGKECDADAVAELLDAAGRSESDLEHDVNVQQQRFTWHTQRAQHQQSIADRQQAERDFETARAALQQAIDRLSPAVESARTRMQVADQTAIFTMAAESHLAGSVLDTELLERESTVNHRLSEVNQELRPLLQDREHKQSSLLNAEMRLQQLTARDPDAWPGFGMINPKYWSNKDIDPARERVADLTNQIAQLDAAIKPRLQEQQRLQAELARIHEEKLQP